MSGEQVRAWLDGEEVDPAAVSAELADPAVADAAIREAHFQLSLRRAVRARDERRAASVRSERLRVPPRRLRARPSAALIPLIAAIAAALLVAGSLVTWSFTGGTQPGESALATRPARAVGTPAAAPADHAVARVLAAPAGAVVVAPASAARALAVGDAVLAGETVALADGAAGVLRLRLSDGGSTIGLGGLSDGGQVAAGRLAVDHDRLTLASGMLQAEVVPHPPERPLVIVAPHARITVVGTRFDVSGDDRSTLLRVHEGVVRFQPQLGGDELVRAGGVRIAGDVAIPEALVAYDLAAGAGAAFTDLGSAGAGQRLVPTNAVRHVSGGVVCSGGDGPTSIGEGDATQLFPQVLAAGGMTLEVVVRDVARGPGGNLMLAEALAFTAPLRAEGTHWPLQIWAPADVAAAPATWHHLAATVGTAGRSRLWLNGRCIDERPLAWPGAALQAPLHMKLMTGAEPAATSTYAWVALLPGELSERQLALRARLVSR